MQFSFSHSDSKLPDSWRIAANIWNVKPTDKLSFNFSGQIWHQPEIKFHQNDKLEKIEGLGGKVHLPFAVSFTFEVSETRQRKISKGPLQICWLIECVTFNPPEKW